MLHLTHDSRGDYMTKPSPSSPYASYPTHNGSHTHPHDTLRSPVDSDLMTPLSIASNVSPLPLPGSSVSVSSVSSVSSPPTPHTMSSMSVHCQWEAAHHGGPGGGGGMTSNGGGPGSDGGFNPYFSSVGDVGVYKNVGYDVVA